MNDEIKEILDYFKKYVNDKYETYTVVDIHTQNLRTLLYYITNLQEENKELKERFDLVCKISEERKNKWLSLNEENDNIVKIIKDYKSRIDKAIEYIKDKVGTEIHDMMYVIDVSDVLDILQGEDNTPKNLYKYTPEKGFRLVGDEDVKD